LKKRYFWSDKILDTKLDTIPEGERSVHIRIALREYFKLTDLKNGQVGYTEDDLKIFDRKDEEDGSEKC
jgi:hypothetical protein